MFMYSQLQPEIHLVKTLNGTYRTGLEYKKTSKGQYNNMAIGSGHLFNDDWTCEKKAIKKESECRNLRVKHSHRSEWKLWSSSTSKDHLSIIETSWDLRLVIATHGVKTTDWETLVISL